MEMTNARKLAAVLTKWARPAISQIATGKIMQISAMKSLQATIVGSGIVGSGYSLENDMKPFVEPIINTLVEPMIYQYVSKVPDEALPKMARSIVDRMIQQGCVSILDGMVTFEAEDILELDELLKRNLPVVDCETYEVI